MTAIALLLLDVITDVLRKFGTTMACRAEIFKGPANWTRRHQRMILQTRQEGVLQTR